MSLSRPGRPERPTTFRHELTGGTPGTLYRSPCPGVVDARPVLVQKAAVPVLAVVKVARDDGRRVPFPSLVGGDGEHVAVVQLELQLAEELGYRHGLARALRVLGADPPAVPPWRQDGPDHVVTRTEQLSDVHHLVLGPAAVVGPSGPHQRVAGLGAIDGELVGSQSGGKNLSPPRAPTNPEAAAQEVSGPRRQAVPRRRP